MSKTTGRRIALVIACLVLLLAPLFVRTVVLGYNNRAYIPGKTDAFVAAATPKPTETPFVAPTMVQPVMDELRSGQVVIDMAHGNGVDRYQFDPLASALASRGFGVRYWMSDIDPMTVTSFLDYPDQSEELASNLRRASGLVVVSPFFLWSKAEISIVEQFVADGGRLLLISDPDVAGDLAQDINGLADPFGIVFASDYLYDTTENDENHVFVFADTFEDDAEHLADSRIAFYGTRSIGGEVTPLVLAASTTLSNLRTGLSGLSTVVRGGLESRAASGGVLAMGDFDVLTMPFVERHDNSRLTDYVADFLTSGELSHGITDFPAALGNEVALVFANAAAVDGQTIEEGSELQRSLLASGRTLSVAGTDLLTQSMMNAAMDGHEAASDIIVLADYAMAGAETALLERVGFTLVEITPTPTPTSILLSTATLPATDAMYESSGAVWSNSAPAASDPGRGGSRSSQETEGAVASTTPGASDEASGRQFATAESQEQAQDQPDATPAPLATATVTATQQPIRIATPTETPTASATPSPTPESTETPTPEMYLVSQDGLRLVAEDTVLISQQELANGRLAVAVIGYDADGVRSGVDRLLDGRFDGCVTSVDLAVCSDSDGETTDSVATARTLADAAETGIGDALSPETDGKKEKLVMVIDDDDLALPGEDSEADLYLKVLTGSGYGPTLWTTSSDGIPSRDDLAGYDWVIWSGGGYASGGPALADLDPLLGYVNSGGALTISSRKPFFGMSTKSASVIADVAVDDDLPPMVYGLPSTAIDLESGLPPVTPLQIGEDHRGAKIVLLRGPDSSDAGAPLLYVVVDDKGDDSTGARLMIAGLSLTWLPDEYSEQLVRNMIGYMTNE